ncbi:MAG: ATP-dependent DNA helicase RecG [Elusimicrobia bacterium RIFOXYA2_FULL_39_19]|nr:MAG: ATP-dependent DNA helicase RecG [Elusimicrobia bacterium RIFOXYA2_FULL_39_19]
MNVLFEKSVKYLKGVGPNRAKILSRIGINSIGELLTYYPREYDDRRTYARISNLKNGQTATISGKVELTDIVKINPYLWVFKAAISDSTGIIYATFYRKPSFRYDAFATLKKDFQPTRNIIINGKVEYFGNTKQLRTDEYEVITNPNVVTIHTNRIVPIYDLTEGLSSKFLRSIMFNAVKEYANQFSEFIPKKYREQYGLIDASSAVANIHFPADYAILEKSETKLVFDEFLLFETAVQISKLHRTEKEKEHTYKLLKHYLTPFKNKLVFEFTQAQKKVINEIFANLQSKLPMNRLLIGDVGSGKTVVALSALLLALENNFQAVFMAPTEILAEQHYSTIKQYLEGLNIKFELLTSSTPSLKKKTILKQVEEGKIDLLIGTHALIESKVKFKNLVFAVIDEQHKFGVYQRKKLIEKGNVDVLIMTATPIPRSLALTLYGDMDISVINEMPPGRKPVKTIFTDEIKAYEFIKNEVKKGHQAYIVFPLVEESDKVELKSAVTQAKHLAQEVFAEFKVGLLHGQMPGKEKEQIMSDFKQKKYDILTTTTVIEVGIDIPNATVIAIEHAERFGLATLHQLRGRVGRSKDLESYCILIGNLKTEDSKKRIDIMLSTNDGFKIAEFDLELRGPGEFFGTSQHGLSELKIGNIVRDIDTIANTKKVAEEVILSDPKLNTQENVLLKHELLQRFAGKFKLFQIG